MPNPVSDPPATPEPIDAEIVEPEQLAPVSAPPPDYDERGVPGFDFVRDKIEGRHATSLGATELAGATAEGATIEEQLTERDRKAKEKLDELRRSMDG